MKMLIPAVSVTDLETSLGFYEAIGMEAVGRASHVGTRIHHLELVQWPDGHPVAMTRADFTEPTEENDR